MYNRCYCFVVWPLVFITLVWSSPLRWNPSDCPQQCVCREESSMKKVYCDIQGQQQLKAIPNKFPSEAQLITLRGNRISTIPAEAFSNLQELRILNLASNELQSLPKNVFRGLRRLESLNLARNRLGRLPSGLLTGLDSLRDLYLDGNVLENLPKNFFQGMTSLRRLFLDSNKFHSLSHVIFGFRGAVQDRNAETSSNGGGTVTRNLTTLVELRLNHNGIEDVQHDSFTQMSVLRLLKLNNNNLTTLPRGLFRDLKSLRLLSLYKNPFKCTCSLKWLKDWITKNRKTVTVFYPHLIKCHGPGPLQGKSLLKVKDEEFGCKETQWGAWSTWTNCSATCDRGSQRRVRNCVGGDGLCVGSDTETRECTVQSCDQGWSVWSAWTSCSASCAIGYQTRNRSTNCKQSPCRKHLESEVRACPPRACPSYAEWSSWSTCDSKCGKGKQTRKRACTTAYQGVLCPGDLTESRDCKIQDCSEWGDWSPWSLCSKTCSRGQQKRRRDCIRSHGVRKNCPGNTTDIRDCNLKECPINGGWSSWLPWSSCSRTCGMGVNTRYRTCSNPYPQHGGAKCKGKHFDVTECVQGLCVDDTKEFTLWSSWSDCSTQCGRGIQVRSRTCKRRDPVSGFQMCLGNSVAYQQCEGKKCEGVWGTWSKWSICHGECINGRRLRWRFCQDNEGRRGLTCKENKTIDIQAEQCKPSKCRHVPVWSAWGSWTECTKTCLGGTKRRRRHCLTRAIGLNCPGNYESKTRCNTKPCPVHGKWSSWSEWGECNAPCEGGIRQRNRTCTNPVPKYNGNPCIGDSTDKMVCNQHRCREDVMSDGNPDTIRLVKHPVCPPPEKPKHGRYVIKEQKDYITFLEYKCDDLFYNEGPSKFRYCTNQGKWSGQAAKCVPKCGEIRDDSSDKRLKRSGSISDLSQSWPWQAEIWVPDKDIHCSGSLIGDQWVLTAAHCVLYRRTKQLRQHIKVILGTHNRTDHSSHEVQVIRVNQTKYHEDFDWDILKSDIAILKLERKVHITKHVHPVCLPKSKRIQSLLKYRNLGVFVGWGSRKNPNLLRQMSLPVVSLKDCEKTYQQNRYKVTEQMLCAGYKNERKGTCVGDSGGGLVFLRKRPRRRSRWILGGIASWGFPKCDVMGKYSVFTDVAKHRDWILNTMENWDDP